MAPLWSGFVYEREPLPSRPIVRYVEDGGRGLAGFQDGSLRLL